MPMILKLPLFFLRNFLIITQYQEPSKSILLPPPPPVYHLVIRWPLSVGTLVFSKYPPPQ